MKVPNVDIWPNGCGANVGKHVITFTGLKIQENNPCHVCHKGSLQSIPNGLHCPNCSLTFDTNLEGVYVTLKYPVWHCPNLLYIKSRSPNDLRGVIWTANLLNPKELSWKKWRRKNRLKYNAYLREYLNRGNNRQKHNKLNVACCRRRRNKVKALNS